MDDKMTKLNSAYIAGGRQQEERRFNKNHTDLQYICYTIY